MKYLTCCIQAHGPDIIEMVEAARWIKRRTFLRYVDQESMGEISRSLGYTPGALLTMAGDYHIRYARSRYKGRPCVFFVHSAIEYIFV